MYDTADDLLKDMAGQPVGTFCIVADIDVQVSIRKIRPDTWRYIDDNCEIFDSSWAKWMVEDGAILAFS